MKLLHVVGARPNFMKLAPVLLAGRASSGLEQHVVHTGQHYDHEMSDRFFDDLAIPRPDENLDVGSGSHAQQTATIMARFEPGTQGVFGCARRSPQGTRIRAPVVLRLSRSRWASCTSFSL